MTTQNERARQALPSAQQLIGALFEQVVKLRGNAIRERVARLHAQHPQASLDELARLLIRNRAFYSGVSGGLSSLGGVVTLPVTLPASVLSSFLFQMEIVLTLAHLYGHDMTDEDRQLDFLMVLVGNRAAEVFKKLGIEAGKQVTRKMVDRFVTREVMTVIWKVLGPKILTKAGTKSMFSLMRAVPLVAAPIGFAFDYGAALAVGKIALRYYRLSEAQLNEVDEIIDAEFKVEEAQS